MAYLEVANSSNNIICNDFLQKLCSEYSTEFHAHGYFRLIKLLMDIISKEKENNNTTYTYTTFISNFFIKEVISDFSILNSDNSIALIKLYAQAYEYEVLFTSNTNNTSTLKLYSKLFNHAYEHILDNFTEYNNSHILSILEAFNLYSKTSTSKNFDFSELFLAIEKHIAKNITKYTDFYDRILKCSINFRSKFIILLSSSIVDNSSKINSNSLVDIIYYYSYVYEKESRYLLEKLESNFLVNLEYGLYSIEYVVKLASAYMDNSNNTDNTKNNTKKFLIPFEVESYLNRNYVDIEVNSSSNISPSSLRLDYSISLLYSFAKSNKGEPKMIGFFMKQINEVVTNEYFHNSNSITPPSLVYKLFYVIKHLNNSNSNSTDYNFHPNTYSSLVLSTATKMNLREISFITEYLQNSGDISIDLINRLLELKEKAFMKEIRI